jgi:transposase
VGLSAAMRLLEKGVRRRVHQKPWLWCHQISCTRSRRRLGAISKQGDSYLRMLIHGARSVLWSAKGRTAGDRLRTWALETETRRGHNVAAVAVANKLARMVWAVWTRRRDYAGTTPTT